MRWAGGAGRCEWCHRCYTFEEILACPPSDPDDTAPEAATPQKASETLLRDRGSGLPPPLHPRNPPPVAPGRPPPGMGHRPHTDLATTPTQGHRKTKGQTEGGRQGGEERRKVTGTPQLKQGTGGNTTRGPKTTGGPPTLGEGKGRGHSTRERGGREDTGQNTHPRRRDAPHWKDRHRPDPHTNWTPRDPKGRLPHRGTRPTTPEAQAHQEAPLQPRPDSAPGHAHKPPAPLQGEGGTPIQETNESTAQPTTAP